jgi:hypothetical protein
MRALAADRGTNRGGEAATALVHEWKKPSARLRTKEGLVAEQ